VTFLAVVVLFPLLFWALSAGNGLLIERLTGTRLPTLLVLPIGFGTLIVVSQFTTWISFLAPLTPIVLALLAVIGFAFSRRSLGERWSARMRGWWLGAAAAVGAYVLVAGPVIASGNVTFTGYLLDTTGAIQIAGAERLLHHAHDFSAGLPAYGTTLAAYFGNGYPSGGHGVLASVAWLSGQNLIWLYTVFQALELSMLALVLTFLASRAGLRMLPAAVTGLVAAVPALLYAYALMGSIKEITALPMIMLMGALLVCARELAARAGVRAVIPFGIAAAAALDAIGIAASPWVGLFGASALVVAVPLTLTRRDWRPLGIGAVGLVAAVVVFGLPTVAPLKKTLGLAKGISNSDPTAAADPGNLLRPLKFIQTFGVWLGETHRLDPRYLNQTYILMGVVIACGLLGLAYLLRRRAWLLLAVVAISFIAWAFLHSHATTWTAAKLLVILSPMVVFVALVGAFGLMETRLLEGLVLGALVIFGVLASDSLLYHGTNLAPHARYQELADVGTRNAGEGPTLAPDFDEYSLYLLRSMAVDLPGVAYAGAFEFVDGAGKAYGHSYDLDMLSLPTLDRFKTIVMRRSPAWSRPPGNFKLLSSGAYYSVWRRQGDAPLAHVPLGEGGWEPASVPSCRKLAGFARTAQKANVPLVYSPRRANVVVDMTKAFRKGNVLVGTDLEGRPLFNLVGPARIESSFQIQQPGRYRLWLGGDLDRPLAVSIDGRLLGSPSRQSGGDGTTIDVASVRLVPGRHTITMVRGGGDLRPDDAGSSVIDGIVLEPHQTHEVASVSPQAYRRLCGHRLDWVEVG
jgi:hypothetical protein